MATKRTQELNLSQNLNRDHKLVLKSLRKLENCLAKAPKNSKLKQAVELLKEIKEEMNDHFQKEEEILFPSLNRHFERALAKMGAEIRPEGGPVNVMLLEHKALRTIMQNLEKATRNGSAKEISSFMTQFAALLRSHVFREENVLYVVAEAKIKKREKAKIMARLRNLPKKTAK